MLVRVLWVKVSEYSILVLGTAFKDLEAYVDHVIEAFRSYLKSCRVSLIKPSTLMLLAHVAIPISIIYHIIFTYDST